MAFAWTTITKPSSAWTIYDADSASREAAVDWDDASMGKWRFDEPNTEYTNVPKGSLTWSAV